MFGTMLFSLVSTVALSWLGYELPAFQSVLLLGAVVSGLVLIASAETWDCEQRPHEDRVRGGDE
jgi:hypothetical protein